MAVGAEASVSERTVSRTPEMPLALARHCMQGAADQTLPGRGALLAMCQHRNQQVQENGCMKRLCTRQACLPAACGTC